MNESTHFKAKYRDMTSEQIVRLASKGGLLPEAEHALNEELAARDLKEADVRQYTEALSQQKLQMKLTGNKYLHHRGTGIAFRGRKYASDEDERRGIQLRTRWLILCWIPLIPLGSYRLRYDGMPSRFWQRQVFEAVSQEKLDWETVIRVWSLTASILLLLYLTFWILIRLNVIS
jgi:hypothetical protein